MSVNNYKNLWFSTEELIKKFNPALSNVFDVYIPTSYGSVGSADINFLSYDAVLPGTSLELAQVYGDRQGRIEQYPTRRIYTPVDVSFYIDNKYDVLRYFEDWMAKISPNLGDTSNSYVKFNYPNTYETDIIITKFERGFRDDRNRLVKNGVYGPPKTYVEYTLRNAYPVNIIAVPISYEGTNVLRTTITFNYDVYNFKRMNDTYSTDSDGTSKVSNPGKDPDPVQPSSVTPAGTSNSNSRSTINQTLSELREIRLRSQNRIAAQGETPVTPTLQGPPSPF
jgi:hypothetical protein